MCIECIYVCGTTPLLLITCSINLRLRSVSLLDGGWGGGHSYDKKYSMHTGQNNNFRIRCIYVHITSI